MERNRYITYNDFISWEWYCEYLDPLVFVMILLIENEPLGTETLNFLVWKVEAKLLKSIAYSIETFCVGNGRKNMHYFQTAKKAKNRQKQQSLDSSK